MVATDHQDLYGAARVSAFFADGVPDAGVSPDAAVDPPNRSPVAIAGPRVAVAVGSTVRLDGTQSIDPDGDPLIYTWTLIDAPTTSTAALTDTETAEPSLTADVGGVYQARLVVSDGLAEAVDTVLIGAGVSASTPNADAGPDRAVAASSVVRLDGSQSRDPDGDELTYEWRITGRPLNASAVLSATDVQQVELVPDNPGAWTIELTVSDGFWEDRDTVFLLVD